MIAIPFNHQPFSTELKSGAYTIPSGKYARVTSFGKVFTVDGDEFIEDSDLSGTSTAASTVVFTNTTSKTLRCIVVNNGNGVANPVLVRTANDDTYYSIANSGGTLVDGVLPVGAKIRTGAAAGTLSMDWFVYDPNNSDVSTEFWLPSGAVITAGEYVVELYNELT